MAKIVYLRGWAKANSGEPLSTCEMQQESAGMESFAEMNLGLQARVPPPRTTLDGMAYALKRRKAIPFEFVLDALSAIEPVTRPMFGCLAIYVGRKIVLILRDKGGQDRDNGVWLATTLEHHESLRGEFPNMRSISVFGPEVTGWQVLRADAPDFEESAMRACELIVARDPRIGKVPKSKKRKKT